MIIHPITDVRQQMRTIVEPHSEPSPETAWRSAWLTAAAVALGAAIHMRDGLVYPSAVAWLAVAMGCGAVALVRPSRGSSLARLLPPAMPWLLCIGIAIQFILLLTYRLPDAWCPGRSAWPYYAMV